MTWKIFFTSSIGKKLLMGLTGILLILFLCVHVGVNASIFVNDNGETFNTAAHFMSHNWVLRIIEIGLFVGLILHIIQGLMLWKQNAAARPVNYAMSDANKNSTWYSRSMGILGSLLLIFLIVHLMHFWVGTKKALYVTGEDHNMYEEMKLVFTEWYWVALYLVGVIALGWHLLHGFQSAFQTLGINHKRYSPIIKSIGVAFSILVPILFALMPLAFYFNWID
jgi:succinate dehydrogenase / fumarate reductase cytochrome b subunit